MTVSVLFFAHYKDIVGERQQTISLPSSSTVAALAHVLEQNHPELGSLLSCGRVAVNEEFAAGETYIADGDEVAWMPPMSGGNGK